MNSNHDNGKTDPSLDDELDQIDQLYRSAASNEPPEMLDQAILNKARRAVEAKNSWLDFGWIHGVTTVALVVLTLSIFTTQRDTGEFEPTVGKSADLVNVEATRQLSGKAGESDASDADLAKLKVAADDDTAVANQPLEAAMEEKLSATKEESREREQDSPQRQMRAPASIAVPAPQADKRGLETEFRAEPTTGMTATSNAGAASVEKQAKKNDQQLDSLDELKDSIEAAPSPIEVQQQMLDQILAYKRNGDERWIEELADFKELYPQFPIPDELEK